MYAVWQYILCVKKTIIKLNRKLQELRTSFLVALWLLLSKRNNVRSQRAYVLHNGMYSGT